MSAEDKAAPSREAVAAHLRALIKGTLSREEVSSWAAQWVTMRDPNVKDKRVWKTLKALMGADLISTDRPYLYGREDFEKWLEELLE